jgi:predicted nucleic acid-binding protein
VITDADSKPRLILAAEKGSPTLEIRDTDDHSLLSLSSDGKAATIVIQDAQGKKLFAAPQ